jgi:aspartate oxidase
VEVKIGVQHAPREITVDTSDSAEEVERLVTEAVKGDGGVLTLSDSKGRRVIVPADRISYVEIGGGVQGTVGFRH